MSTLTQKVELTGKGQTAAISDVQQLKSVLKWKTAQDFDVAAIVVDDQDKAVMVYYANKGDLNHYPFIKLSGDAGVGDKVDGQENEEDLVINKIDPSVKTIYLIAWDFGAAKSGQAARFSNDLKMQVISVGANATDNLEASLDLSGSTVAGANGVVVSKIVKTALGYNYENVSAPFVLTKDSPSAILAAIGVTVTDK